MNRLITLILILFVYFIPACSSTPEQYTKLDTRVANAMDTQSILVQVDHGEVIVLGAEEQQVQVGGQVLFADTLEYQVSSTEKQILIKANVQKTGLSNMPLRVEVRVPKEILLKVETDSASTFISGYQGNLEVVSTSGNITVGNVSGKITLRSNRGNITVWESSGDINVVGNYGQMNAQDVHGETGISTIMGNVVFNGLIQAGDAVHLETDHGAVSVNLNPDSALSLQVHSTSGDVVCMLPNIDSSTRSCDGEYQSDGGMLSIRTVSGAVALQLIP